MTETTQDDQAAEHQTAKALALAVSVSALCLLGIVVVQLVRRFMNSIIRSDVEPGQLDNPTDGPLYGRGRGPSRATCGRVMAEIP
jgi:hypothetical protein